MGTGVVPGTVALLQEALLSVSVGKCQHTEVTMMFKATKYLTKV